MGWQQGLYEVKHPDKYAGDLTKVTYRSSWELESFRFCDNNPNVIQWSSEEIAIPYSKPTPSGSFKPAKYYPDLYIEYINTKEKRCKVLIEIKPTKQTRPSRARNPKTKMFENQAYLINELKWEAARNWCLVKGIEFRIITENDQFN